MKILVLDTTEDARYFSAVSKYFDQMELDTETVTDRAASKVATKAYDLIIMSDIPGKMDMLDLTDKIAASVLNRKCEVVLMVDNPTKMHRIKRVLSGRGFRALKTDQIAELCSIFERK